MEALYKYVVPKPKSQCSKTEQLGVSFAAGYIAGVFCAVVSHPADNLVSKLNSQKGATIGSIVNEMGWRAPPALRCDGAFSPIWLPGRPAGVLSPSSRNTSLHFGCGFIDYRLSGCGKAACGTELPAKHESGAAGGRGKLTPPVPVRRTALFTRGLPLRIVMIGTLTGLQWGIYDAFKVYVGLCVPSHVCGVWPAASSRNRVIESCLKPAHLPEMKCAVSVFSTWEHPTSPNRWQPGMPGCVCEQSSSRKWGSFGGSIWKACACLKAECVVFPHVTGRRRARHRRRSQSRSELRSAMRARALGNTCRALRRQCAACTCGLVHARRG